MEEQTRKLLTRFLDHQCSHAEAQQVNQLLEDPEMVAQLHQLMEEQDARAAQQTALPDHVAAEKMESWQQQINERIADSAVAVQLMRRLPWLRYAAIFTGFVLLAGITWLLRSPEAANNRQLAQQTDILPGGHKATLTLADGSVISLEDATSGTLARQDGIQIEKTRDGNILYRMAGDKVLQGTTTNTITTPKGGQYQVCLPDGTRAWLNAASSLSYPLHFDAKERRVKMTGEVYFEVAKLYSSLRGGRDRRPERVPFFVETDKQEIQVLGTHFNVNAYPDETAVKTTLVEGSVRVHARNGQSALLKPGQQAVLDGAIRVRDADIEQQLAWKNGDFIFRGETLESVLRQVSRWYDIEVEYPHQLGNMRFNGMVSRLQPLSTIIEMIQSTKKATATLKGRRLIVTD
ncbi:FecR family protein [Pedobacter africanus]|uniref:FecR family protein n=1 Tax=Pedobacter africanus TaxID=151894 RepID=A0A1W2D9T2_9SPHI|nr:FecR family protein [Pedobacter africanus]SMC94143.1 FecR family protein [Pedobacter africanus]